jgi:hypothetical protein
MPLHSGFLALLTLRLKKHNLLIVNIVHGLGRVLTNNNNQLKAQNQYPTQILGGRPVILSACLLLSESVNGATTAALCINEPTLLTDKLP